MTAVSVGGCPRGGPSAPTGAAERDDAYALLVEVTGPEIVERARASDARFTLVNVWATWCGPCREEFPYIQRITRSYADRGVDLVFVSTDFDTERQAALEFLRSQDADLPSFIKVGDDQSFIDALSPDWTGSMPFTVIFDARGQRVKVWQGRVEAEELEAALAALTREDTPVEPAGR